MRALRDFNTPKIVTSDEIVFYGLLGDLFPGVDPPRKANEVCLCVICSRGLGSSDVATDARVSRCGMRSRERDVARP